MPPRKKTRGTLKRSSSDGPASDDAPINPKRPRPDVSSDVSSHITLDTVTAAHRARKPITYKSKARQKAGLSAATPPKLTSFGFNVEHKPKAGRALFHLSPSPRAKAKAKAKIKVFGNPKANRRRASKGGGTTSAETSRIEVESDEEEEEEADGPEPNSSFGASAEHGEVDDEPAPLPTLPAVRPIEGPGLEIRTPLKGRIIPPSLQSLSKRNPRTDATPVPLFAATPRLPLLPLPDDTNPPASPTKAHNIPVFAPINPVPSTPAHRPRAMSAFTPIVHRNQDEGQDSPAKKPLPVFAPTPARRQQSEPPAPNPFASVTTPAHSHTLPVAPPKLPTMSSAIPETEIPATPTAKGRSLPIFTPKMLFPRQEPEAEPAEKEEKAVRGVRGTKVSKAPVFGVLEEGEGEEPTPRANRKAEQPETQNPLDQQADEDQGEGDVSMADIFNASVGQFSPQSERVLTGGQGFPASLDQLDQPPPLTNGSATTTETNPGPSTSRVTRSRSRSASASGSVAAGSVTRSRAGSQVPQTKAGSVAPSSRAESVIPDSQPSSQSAAPAPRASSIAPTPVAQNAPTPIASGSTSSTPRSVTIPLVPLVTDAESLVALKSQSRTNSMDQHRLSQTAVMMMDTPGDETPSAFPELEGPTASDADSADDMDAETSPLSSLPEDMSFSFLGVGGQGDTTMGETVGNSTAGDTTMRDAGETTVRDELADRSMEMRDPSNLLALSPPISPPAPTSPVSSVPGDPFMRGGDAFSSPRKQPLPSSSPTRPDVMVPISDDVRPIVPLPSTRSRSSSLTSLSDLTDLSDEEKPMEVEKDDKGKAPTRKSMIPVAKRPGTPGLGHGPPTPGATGSKTPFRSVSASGVSGMNGVTPGPSRNGAPLTKNGLASVKGKVAPMSGTTRIGAATPSASSSKVLPPASTPAAGSSTTLGMGKPPGARSTMAARTRSGAVKARSLAAPTASTAAKTRAKVVTAPPPPRGRITSFMKPNAARPGASTSTMAPPPAPTASTSASPRKGQSKDDSDIRGPRRSMISQDTQASLSSLSSALEKLARPPFGSGRGSALPPRPGTSMGFAPPRPGSSLGFSESGRAGGGDNALSSSVGPGGSKPMIKSASVATTAAPVSSTSGKGKGKAKEGEDDAAYEEPGKAKPKDDPNAPLRSCVIFVDVRTAEGEDAGSLFVDMLKGLGAKIVSRPSPSTTHIVFKSGHQSTLTKYKLYDDPKPFLIGIGWVVQCVEKRARVDEESFAVKTDQVSALDLKKRRKSQLPHQMQFMARDPNPNGPKFGSMSAEAAAVSKSLEASAAEVAQDAELAAERARQRTQQKLFPRVRDRSPS